MAASSYSSILTRNSKTLTAMLTPTRGFAVGKKKGGGGGGGGKGGGAEAPQTETLSKEVKSSTVVGGNILKEGSDAKITADSDYPDWLFGLLARKLPLSELKRKKLDSLAYEDLRRFYKLDNRARIKENNSIKAKN